MRVTAGLPTHTTMKSDLNQSSDVPSQLYMPQLCTAPMGMSPTPAQESMVVAFRKLNRRISPHVSGPKSMFVVPWS
jgi:hypothetical protein